MSIIVLSLLAWCEEYIFLPLVGHDFSLLPRKSFAEGSGYFFSANHSALEGAVLREPAFTQCWGGAGVEAFESVHYTPGSYLLFLSTFFNVLPGGLSSVSSSEAIATVPHIMI